MSQGRARIVTVSACAVIAVCRTAPAPAETYCVSTAGTLQSALTAAAASAGSDEIHVVDGTYDSPDGGFTARLDDSGDLAISGGWITGCLFRQKRHRSTIDGRGFRPGMVIIGASGGAGTDALTISHLAFVNGLVDADADDSNRGGGLTVNVLQSSTSDVTIDSNRFSDNATEDPVYGFGGGLRLAAPRNVVVSNNVFLGNHARGGGAGASISCGSVLAKIVNNTVTGNTAGNGDLPNAAGMLVQGDCFTEMSNNILWGNGGEDLTLYARGVRLYHNDIADRGGPESPAVDVGNVDVIPHFVSSSDLHLRPSSSLIDAGHDAPMDGLPTIDHDDRPRLAGAHVDIGAYETIDLLFADGFEP